MNEAEQLHAAIVAQESLRGTVDDSIVDAASAALRRQLAAIEGPDTTRRRKLVTVLFADVSGSTALGEQIDAEELSDRFDVLWRHLDAIIQRYGGRIDKHIGDAVMALWGVDHARDNDPERAIRAALDMQHAVTELAADGVTQGLQMRIGINTGPVVLGEIPSTEEFTAMGDAVNVAARLEAAAPVGSILVGHESYRHVRGVFSVRTQAPLAVKGKSSTLRTYLVDGIRPRAFRLRSRGIEGIETSMFGRDAELEQLQTALTATIETSTSRAVMVIGEAGIGKSRLVYEFEDWLRVQPHEVRLFTGRADLGRHGVPYALVRDLLVGRFEITEDDPAEVALAKLTVGFRDLAGDELAAEASVVGHLVGLEANSNAPDAQELVERSTIALARLLAGAASTMPVVVLLEDLQWADRSSLQMLRQIRAAVADAPVLIVGLTRPTPDDAALGDDVRAIALAPLSDDETRLLVDEILQRLPEVPDRFRSDMIEAAAGQPYFVEELVRMMIDEEVIVADELEWRLQDGSTANRSIPSTVTGVIQARLDLLGAEERATLQRAAVVGRVFWDDSIPRAECGLDPVPVDVRTALATLTARGLVECAGTADSGRAAEYRFQNAILHEVTYQSVLRQDRRELHRSVADRMSGQRDAVASAHEVAEHYAAGGATRQAALWFARAGSAARRRCAVDESIDACNAALESDALEAHERLDVLDDLCESLSISTRYDEALDVTQRMELLAGSTADDRSRALALMHRSHLHLRLGKSRAALGDAQEALDLTLRIAASSDEVIQSITELAWVMVRLGNANDALDRGTEALDVVDAATSTRTRRNLHSMLGSASYAVGAHARAATHLSTALTLDRQQGDRRGEAANLINLGEVARLQGDVPEAITRFGEATKIVVEIGDRDQEALVLSNLGGALLEMGEVDAAMPRLDAAIEGFERSGGTEHTSETHRFLAEAHLARGDIADAHREAQQALDLARVDENPDHLGHAWRVLGLVGAHDGDDTPLGDDAETVIEPERCIETGIAIFGEAGMERDRAIALADLSFVQASGGHTDAALTASNEVRRILAGLGLSRVLDRLEPRLVRAATPA